MTIAQCKRICLRINPTSIVIEACTYFGIQGRAFIKSNISQLLVLYIHGNNMNKRK